MPKLEERVQALLTRAVKIDLSPAEKWCMYLKYRHEDRAARLEEGIMRAERAVEGISRDYRKFAREMAATKNKMDRAQERYEGREEKALEIARNMVSLGLPFETVVSATRLEPEKVKVLYQGTVMPQNKT
jgi:hypothetical protein